VALVRPLVLGQIPANIIGHLSMLLVVALVAFQVALVLTRRRLLK
jgi:lipooligosaccharide transport system permease protein